MREILKVLRWSERNTPRTPRHGEAGRRQGEHQQGQGRIQTEHERDGVDNGDNGDRPQMADDDRWQHHAVQSTRCTIQLVVARSISSLHRCRCVVRWRGRPCATWNASRGSDDTSSGGRERGAGSVGSRVASWKRTLTGEATRPAGRSVSAGVITRCGHCLKVWTQVVSLSPAGSELYAAVKTASEGLGIQSVTKDMGISCGLNTHRDATATMCLVNRRGLGKAKHVDMQNLWIKEASKSRAIRHEEGRHEREPS